MRSSPSIKPGMAWWAVVTRLFCLYPPSLPIPPLYYYAMKCILGFGLTLISSLLSSLIFSYLTPFSLMCIYFAFVTLKKRREEASSNGEGGGGRPSAFCHLYRRRGQDPSTFGGTFPSLLLLMMPGDSGLGWRKGGGRHTMAWEDTWDACVPAVTPALYCCVCLGDLF